MPCLLKFYWFRFIFDKFCNWGFKEPLKENKVAQEALVLVSWSAWRIAGAHLQDLWGIGSTKKRDYGSIHDLKHQNENLQHLTSIAQSKKCLKCSSVCMKFRFEGQGFFGSNHPEKKSSKLTKLQLENVPTLTLRWGENPHNFPPVGRPQPINPLDLSSSNILRKKDII